MTLFQTAWATVIHMSCEGRRNETPRSCQKLERLDRERYREVLIAGDLSREDVGRAANYAVGSDVSQRL